MLLDALKHASENSSNIVAFQLLGFNCNEKIEICFFSEVRYFISDYLILYYVN